MKITICGSMVFYKDMEKSRALLEVQGHEIRTPILGEDLPADFGEGRLTGFGTHIEENGGIDNFAADHKIWDYKSAAIKDHYDKIDWCDAILIINHEKRGVPGYIGGNTLMEMGLAFYLKKPIYLLNEVSSELLYKQEVMGMKPVLLNGDLSKIQ